jgi:hypothetical protein
MDLIIYAIWAKKWPLELLEGSSNNEELVLNNKGA